VLALHLQVIGTCSVRGKYAQVGANNWPAQLIICGDPPGASSCAGAVYSSSLPVIEPGAPLLLPALLPALPLLLPALPPLRVRTSICNQARMQHSCSIPPLNPAICFFCVPAPAPVKQTT
jgi:hypothetical protein